MYFDYQILGIILIPAILFSLYAQIKVNSNFEKYSSFYAQSGIRACDLIRRILDQAGLYDVKIVQLNGEALNNYYDPSKKLIGLSYAVYNSNSISALGVACHEAGHALQYADNYVPIKLRNALIPACNFISTFLWPIIFIGLFLNFTADTGSVLGITMLYAGIIFFGISVVLNLLTLPAEYNASNRAIAMLDNLGVLDSQELVGAKKVLRSAGLTYVAALFVSILNLLRFLLLFRRRD